jgi:hypothetical protein
MEQEELNLRRAEDEMRREVITGVLGMSPAPAAAATTRARTTAAAAAADRDGPGAPRPLSSCCEIQ